MDTSTNDNEFDEHAETITAKTAIENVVSHIVTTVTETVTEEEQENMSVNISNTDMDISQEEQTVKDVVNEENTVPVNNMTNTMVQNDMDISQEDASTTDNDNIIVPEDDVNQPKEDTKEVSGETVSDTTELGNGNMQGLLIVGKSVDVQQHSRVVEALEQYNKFQKEKHLTTVTDNDNAAVKEDDHVENIAVEGKVAAPPAPSSLTDLSAMPPLPPKANTTTTKKMTTNKKENKVHVAPARAKGVSPMKKKQRSMRHSISSMDSLKSRRSGRVSNTKPSNPSFLKSGPVRNSVNKSKSMKSSQQKKDAARIQQRSRLRASTGTFKTTSKRGNSSSSKNIPSYMRGTSSSSSRRNRRSSSVGIRDRSKISNSSSSSSSNNNNISSKNNTNKITTKHNNFMRKKKKPSLTVPTAPKFTTRESHIRKKKVLSTEEMQIQEGARRREELARQRKMNAKMWNLASASDGTLGVPAGTLGQVLKPKSLTEAKSPNFQAHPVKKTITETTEERELREIELKKEQIAKRKKDSYRRWSLAQSGGGNGTKKSGGIAGSTKPLTKAKTPFLHTKAKKGPKIRVGQMAQPKFTSMRLRSYDRKAPVKAMHKLTVPTTPKFASDSRIGRKATQSNEPYVSVAEMANKVWNGKNMRFIKEPKGSKPVIPLSLTATGPKEVTEPHTPRFQTSSRVRQNEHIESRDEREAREMAEIAAKPFKASKFDEKIKESNGELGISRVQRKPLTKPESPKFATDSRIGRRSSITAGADKKESTHTFKALAVGEGVPEYNAPFVEKKKLTEFKPFNLSTNKRATSHQTNEKRKDPASKYKPFKARPMPSVQTAHMPKVEKKELTIPQSPQLLGTQKSLMAKKALELKIKKERDEAERKRVFKAKAVGEGVPNENQHHYQQPYNPQYEVKPFNLSNNDAAKARRSRQIEKEKIAMEENRKFKARQLPSTHSKPFQPNMSESNKKPFTEIKEFNLRSNIRSEKHKKFDLAAKKRREEAMEKKRMEQEEAEREEAEAYKEQFERTRVDKVRKSKEDVKKFMNAPAVSARASRKRLVIPRSPKLGAARRVLKR